MEEEIIFRDFDCSKQSLKVQTLDTKLRLVCYECFNNTPTCPVEEPRIGFIETCLHVSSAKVFCPWNVSCWHGVVNREITPWI
ncbi:unnamed protein product [Calypogeia fissa]